jgi:hypothetical protein
MNYIIFDKRQEKPKLFNLKETEQDVTLNAIKTFVAGKSEIKFTSPNITAIFIGKSDKEMKLAFEMYNQIIKPKTLTGNTYMLNDDECIQFYDYLEHIQTSIIMIFSAVESLVNILIPNDYLYMKKYRGKLQNIGKKIIEKSCGTEEKLVEILPKALNIKSPTQFNCWENFKLLKKLRDDIVHAKDDKAKVLIEELMNFKVFKLIESGKNLIENLKEVLPQNNKFPILKETEPLIKEYYQNMEHAKFSRKM